MKEKNKRNCHHQINRQAILFSIDFKKKDHLEIERSIPS